MLRYRVGFDLKRIPLARCRSVEYSVPSHQWKMIRLLPRFLPPRRFIDIFCLLMNIPRQNHMKTKEISLTSRIHHQSVIFSLFEQAGRWAFEYAHQLWIFLFYLLLYIPFTFHLVTSAWVILTVYKVVLMIWHQELSQVNDKDKVFCYVFFSSYRRIIFQVACEILPCWMLSYSTVSST